MKDSNYGRTLKRRLTILKRPQAIPAAKWSTKLWLRWQARGERWDEVAMPDLSSFLLITFIALFIGWIAGIRTSGWAERFSLRLRKYAAETAKAEHDAEMSRLERENMQKYYNAREEYLKQKSQAEEWPDIIN
jgi:hypothetical protein